MKEKENKQSSAEKYKESEKQFIHDWFSNEKNSYGYDGVPEGLHRHPIGFIQLRSMLILYAEQETKKLKEENEHLLKRDENMQNKIDELEKTINSRDLGIEMFGVNKREQQRRIEELEELIDKGIKSYQEGGEYNGYHYLLKMKESLN